jgi:dipeptidyl aminopeptidase/acylaminoacyl peptidase
MTRSRSSVALIVFVAAIGALPGAGTAPSSAAWWQASVLPPQTAAPAQGRGSRDAAAFQREIEMQARIDAAWRAASQGHMRIEKTTYASRLGGLEIPVFVFRPLENRMRGARGHAALVWVHPDIRGRVYPYYIPYVRDAVARGYVVIAPEYRGGLGYGQAHYDAIDYGGAEVDDVLTAVDYLKSKAPEVDPARIGIIGWSHGGMITILAATREPKTFAAAAALVPVTNLFQRLAWKGVEQQHQRIDPQNRYGGLPSERQNVYKERSPVYQIEKLQIPLLVHITRNDTDVNIEEAMQLVDALRARKADLAETKIYDSPQGGHLFDRQSPSTGRGGRGSDVGDLTRYVPTNTREQRDSWNRVWTFLDWNLEPYK